VEDKGSIPAVRVHSVNEKTGPGMNDAVYMPNTKNSGRFYVPHRKYEILDRIDPLIRAQQKFIEIYITQARVLCDLGLLSVYWITLNLSLMLVTKY
jgi:hypothetical protein